MSIWPVTNRSDTLGVDLHYLRRRIGEYFGYKVNPASWNTEQIERVDQCIDEGLRQYYYPPPLTAPYAIAVQEAHEWSWMRPTYELKTKSGQRTYPLPPDWERAIGDFTYSDTSNDYYAPIRITSVSRLRSLEYQTNFISYPQFAAVSPVVSTGKQPQRLEVIFHPTPDDEYQLSIEYQAHGKRLTEDEPWPLGGQIHGMGILASCMAAAEMQRERGQGPLHKAFMQTLAGNVARDYQRGACIIGYNSDGWDYKKSRGLLRDFGALFYNNITYEGTSYEG